MGRVVDFLNKFRVSPGPDKLSATAIRRSISVFSYICGVFVFLVFGYFAYEFFGISNTIAVVLLLSGFLLGLITRKLVFNIGIRRARKKHYPLLNELVVIKWGRKRTFGFSLLTILSSGLFFIIFVLLMVPNINVVSADNIILGAHRGDSVKYVENTLPAILSAVEDDDYKFVEFDVQFTRDKKLVVFHDESLIRMQAKFHYIGDLTYDELSEISDYHIPLYSEVMDVAAGKKPLNIDIRSRGNLTEDKDVADFVVADTKSRGIFDITLFSSASSDVVMYFSEAYPEAKTGKIYWVNPSTFLNFDDVAKEMYEELEYIGADYLMLHASNLHNYYALQKMRPIDKDIVIWYFTNEMYIIPSENHNITDVGGNLVGYAVSEADRRKGVGGGWEVTWDGRRVFGNGVSWFGNK